MSTLWPAKAGQMTAVDGHLSASGSRGPRHKGQSTRLGRIMAGSHAVSAPDETGPALFVAYDPPAIPLSQVSVAYCQHVRAATGSALFGIDRAVNAVARARAVDDPGLGWLCRLDAHEPQGLDRFEATQVDTRADGTRVSSGPWKVSRPAAPRHVVLGAPPEGKILVSWATPQGAAVLAVTAWPRGSRARNELQAQSFPRMIAQGARTINSGRQRLVGPDRPQQRAHATLTQALEATQKRVEKTTEALKVQQDQVAESELQGQSKRLAQRQRA
jgi:hypothetical protein